MKKLTKPVAVETEAGRMPMDDKIPEAEPEPALTARSARAPLTDLASQPAKFEEALKIAKLENNALDIFAASSRAIYCSGAIERSLARLKDAQFYLTAPAAKSVQLVADFTDWEKFPLDMMPSGDGVWFTAVPLPAGKFLYRFIVDGKWCDDPRPVPRVPNPFGTTDAVIHVV